ncbi:hypothetical protein SPI_09273 [Niveomyces insectorum RCEF 264]|uniref:Uncharacterized protein n=1 Tax=Niveomyces insectorum RCEF 264 TaxID=1081102 RepID=A0A162K628_9HYPO|nr:hypothetical protein SPI_09273 [Niveomyces insectorum RCEF 264]
MWRPDWVNPPAPAGTPKERRTVLCTQDGGGKDDVAQQTADGSTEHVSQQWMCIDWLQQRVRVPVWCPAFLKRPVKVERASRNNVINKP